MSRRFSICELHYFLTGTLVEALNPVNLNSDDLKLDDCQTLDLSDVHWKTFRSSVFT